MLVDRLEFYLKSYANRSRIPNFIMQSDKNLGFSCPLVKLDKIDKCYGKR